MTTGDEAAAPLLAEFDRGLAARNGVPDQQLRADRRRCLELVQAELAGGLGPGDVTMSPLGVEWTDVFDVRAEGRHEPARLQKTGWIPLDAVVADGRRSGGPRRWAVVEGGRVLAGVRFVDDVRDPVRSVLDRCRERSEVRLREVLELRELRRAGLPFPTGSAILRTAADVESGVGGRLLASWASGRTLVPPVALPGGRRRLVVGISGVDGSGKSTVRAALADSLDRAGVPTSTVWVRPGMGLGPIASVAAWIKRGLRQQATPGLRAMADPTAPRPVSRRGATGYLWALVVSLSFLAGVWRQHRGARGVVLYDRHLVDALATLDFAYEGVDLRLPHLLVRTLLPRADVRVYLDVSAEESLARKPDDVLGEHAVRSQLAAYARWLERVPPTLRLDATRPVDDLVAEVLRRAATGSNTRHKRPRSR